MSWLKLVTLLVLMFWPTDVTLTCRQNVVRPTDFWPNDVVLIFFIQNSKNNYLSEVVFLVYFLYFICIKVEKNMSGFLLRHLAAETGSSVKGRLPSIRPEYQVWQISGFQPLWRPENTKKASTSKDTALGLKGIGYTGYRLPAACTIKICWRS
jgi:hypothetical protein